MRKASEVLADVIQDKEVDVSKLGEALAEVIEYARIIGETTALTSTEISEAVGRLGCGNNS